ncbi:FxSxx-COOH system tetratricopeptide repeat protein [Streptomyces sp. MBT65]|uniref:FxSxx-COOH system tetratricopeptide repeat protein n=1 Tax=Streptomyces sp. MBT65 TaxID=1488395 RepID=UPI0027DA80C0|nr:FxSxx-COOH system tetratricopeptide repeat protein [Streptomyces sp. MBT65]
MTRHGSGEPDTDEPLGISWSEIADALILLVNGAGTDPAGNRTGTGGPSRSDLDLSTPLPTDALPEDEHTSPQPDPGHRGPGSTDLPGRGGQSTTDHRPGGLLAQLGGLVGRPPGSAVAGGARSAHGSATAHWVTSVPSRSRELTRALRPFKRPTLSTTEVELDEEATAESAALSSRWVPEYRPLRERWMDAALIVDVSSSMTVWRRPAAEFEEVLRHTGAFRDIRVHEIDGDKLADTEPSWHIGRSTLPVRRPDLGRQVVLLLTDGVGPGWRSGRAARLLGEWARHASVAVVHVLAQSAWHRTGLPARLARVRVPGPGAPNGSWQVRGAVQEDGPVVPVLELAPSWLARWAQVAAGLRPGAQELWVTSPGQFALAEAFPEEASVPNAMERVSRFRADASPAAWELAARLSAIPLNIPTMEFALQTGDSGTGPGELAEVLLSGLLRQVGTNPLNESEIAYEFHDGVRDLMLSAAPSRDETRYLLRSTLERLGRNWQPLRELGALLDDPHTPATELTLHERLIPYAAIQVKVARALSGPYLASSRSLRSRLEQYAPAHPPPGTGQEGESTTAIIQGPEVINVAQAQNPSQDPPEAGTTNQRNPVPVELPEEYTEGDPVSLPLARSGPAVEERRAGDLVPVWNVQPRNQSFTGRGKELDALHRRLTLEGAAAVLPEALHGLGGVGKTQIAVEYVYQHADEYDVIWWISAERPEQIRVSLTQLGGALGIETGGEQEITIAAVLNALRTGRPYHRWLLVFDNAEDPEVVRQFFPLGGPGKILVTSRNPQWGRIARTVDIDVFTTEESVELLARRGPELQPDQAARVADALGNLPLALEQAAAWLSETGMPVDEYLQIFEDERADLDSQRNELLASGVPVDYPEPVAAAWNMSLGRLAERHPGAHQLLQACSFFAPEPIARRIFTGVRGVELPAELTEVLRDPVKLGQAIREISRYSLIKINHRDNTIHMHRLVRAVLVGRMSPQERADMRHAAHILLATYDPGDMAVNNWPRYAELLVHARFSRAVDCDDGWVRDMVRNVVRYLHTSGDHVTCREYGREVVEAWTERLGESDLQTLAVASTLGHALRTLGNFKEASDLNDKNLRLLRATVGDDHPNTLGAIGAVSENAQIRGDFAASVELEEDRWRRARRENGDGDPTTLAAANDYALALRLVGKFEESLEIDTQARESAVRSLGYDALLTLLITTNLSIDVRETGDYLASRQMQEEALQRVRHAIRDRTAPISLIAARTLAVARRKAGDHAGALELNEETLRLYRSRFGERNLNVAATVLNVSMDLRQNAELERARTVGAECLKTLRDVLGPRHPYVLAAAADLAVTMRLLGEAEQALTSDKETYTTHAEVLGADHPGSLSIAINLASDHYALADYAEAAEIDERTLPVCRTRLGENHPATLACAMNLSLDLRALGRSQEGETIHADTLQRYRTVLGANHPATVGCVRGMRADCDVEAHR